MSITTVATHYSAASMATMTATRAAYLLPFTQLLLTRLPPRPSPPLPLSSTHVLLLNNMM